MPETPSLSQPLKDVEPDGPPMTPARLQDGEDERDMGAPKAAETRHLQLNASRQGGEMASVRAVATEGRPLPGATARADPGRHLFRQACLHPTAQQPLDTALQAAAADGPDRPQNPGHLLQLSIGWEPSLRYDGTRRGLLRCGPCIS